jgi:hypothetical protein
MNPLTLEWIGKAGTMRLKITAILLVLAIALFGYAAFLWYGRSSGEVQERCRRTLEIMEGCYQSYEGYRVDFDGVPMWDPRPGNYFQPILTTPTAYLTRLPQDPFAPKGEELRFVKTFDEGWDLTYCLASRGPDGDCDIMRLPFRKKVPMSLLLPYDVAEYQTTSMDHPAEFPWGWRDKALQEKSGMPIFYCQARVLYYKRENGQRVDVPEVEIVFLPDPPKGNYWSSREALLQCLEQNGVSAYDPTNGIKSEGDILWLGGTGTPAGAVPKQTTGRSPTRG